MNVEFTNLINTFKTNTDLVSKVMNQIPSDGWLSRPGDGSNHPLWIVGHVITTRGAAIRLLGGSWTDQWNGLFDRGAALNTPETYPSVAELKPAWDEVTTTLMSTLGSASPEALAQPSRKPVPSFDEKLSGNIVFLGYHETYHVGQLACLTKWLGGGQLVG